MRRNRKTLVCGILALAMILTGTGYAFWSDTLNVTTTATTGDFGVVFVDLGLMAQHSSDMSNPRGWSIVDGITGKIGENEEFKGFIREDFFARGTADHNDVYGGNKQAYLDYAAPYSEIKFSAELVDPEVISRAPNGVYDGDNGSDQIVITIDNMYPGYAQAFRTDIVNVGTVAAQLSDIKFAVDAPEGKDTPNEELLDMLGIAVLVKNEYYRTNHQYDPDRSGNRPVFKLCTMLGANYATDIFTVGDVDFLRLSALDGISATDFENALTNVNLMSYPGADNRMDLFLGVAMDPDVDGNYTSGTAANRLAAGAAAKDDAQSQSGAVEITIDLLWDQFNVGSVNADIDPNALNQQNYVATPPAA